MHNILTVGEPLGVLAPAEPGRVGVGTALSLRVAGSELNVAVALARLGVPVWFAGAVGPDPVGAAVRRVLAGEGVNCQFLQDGAGPTGLMLKEWYGLGIEPRVYYYRRDTAIREWVPPAAEALAAVDWIHISGITLMLDAALTERITDWVTDRVRAGVQLSVDINLRRRLGGLADWRRVLARIVPLASVIFASREELEVLPEGSGSGAAVLIVTDGAEGSWAEAGGSRIARAEAWPVARVVDVVGAGDGFVGGVLAARSRGWEWADSLKLGSLVGAFAVAHPGDYDGYPGWADVQAVWDSAWVDR